MKFNSSINERILSLNRSVKRFPLTIAFCIVTAAFMILINHNRSIFSQITTDRYMRFALISTLGITLSLCFTAFLERQQFKSNKFKLGFLFLGFSLLVLYYIFLLTNFHATAMIRYSAVNASLFLCFIYIPYLSSSEGFEGHVITLITSFFTALIYSLIIFLGTTAILFTINKLLLINISGKIYYDIFLISLIVAAPSIFLSGVPVNTSAKNGFTYPKFLKLLLIYIVIPLVSIYTIILYLYFGKIIFSLQWPLQLVMHLVFWYSLVTILILFLTAPLKTNNILICKFHKYVTKLIYPLNLMMFISIYQRVKSYGVTENRYFIVLLGLWIIGIMFYLNLRKINNVVIPLSLSIILLLSVFGPQSAFSISKFSQNNRLKALLLKNSMLKNEKILPAKQGVSDMDKREMSGIVDYFSRYHKLSDIKYAPINFQLGDMKRIFGFESVYSSVDYNKLNYFSYNSNLTSLPVSIKGYDYLLYFNNEPENNISITPGVGVDYVSSTTELKITTSEKLVYSILLSKYIKELYQKYGSDGAKNIDPKDMIFEAVNDKLKLKYIFLDVSGNKDNNTQQLKVDYLRFYLLIKLNI